MAPKYNLFFIPKIDNRKKLSELRKKICKQTRSTYALNYPLHMSLISGGFNTKNYSSFEKELKIICKNQNKMILQTEKLLGILPKIFWTGINIRRTKEIKKLQTELQSLRNKFANKKGRHLFRPLHITFAFPAKVEKLKSMICPIKKMEFDRIAIVKKDTEDSKYKIFKYIKFS